MKTNYIRKWLLATGLLIVVLCANAVEIGGIKYELYLSTKTAKVTGSIDSQVTQIVIPSSIEYGGVFYTVNSIGKSAFSSCKSLTTVNLPESLTSIEERAFEGCSSLTTITLPEGLRSIGERAFAVCKGLISVTSKIKDVFWLEGGAFGAFCAISPQCVLNIPAGMIYEYVLYGWDVLFGGGINDPEVGEIPETCVQFMNFLYECEAKKVNLQQLYLDYLDYLDYLKNLKWDYYYASYDYSWEIYNLFRVQMERQGITSVEEIYMSVLLKEQVENLGRSAEEMDEYCNSFEQYGVEYDGLEGKIREILAQIKEMGTMQPVTEEDEIRLIMLYMQIAEELDNLNSEEEELATHLAEIPDAISNIKSAIENDFSLEAFLEDSKPKEYDGVQYQLMADMTAVVVGYNAENAPSKDVVIKPFIEYDGQVFPVTMIGSGAFAGSDIESVDIPEDVEEIGTEAFSDCFLLVTIKMRCKTIPYFSTNCFSGVPSSCGFYVSESLLSTYSSGTGTGTGSGSGFGPGWVGFTSIYCVEYHTFYLEGYATLYTPKWDLEIPEGITAYTGIVNGNILKLHKITDKIPAGTAAVVKGYGGTYKFYYTEGAEPVGENDLKGSATDVVADGSQYVLYDKDDVYGFYKAQTGSVIPAGKAYLEIADASVKGGIILSFDDETGIESLILYQSEGDNVIYDLSGRRAKEDAKGLYIVNGKKVLK